ncbi:MAG: lipopolysaccharide biosynthesis protein [Dysgonamonadaceae bacterium]|jgi:uncharacterized protein involved in exopolysaccharide biosynthesis|nr:lipopolysaccharide biosynthesis protein [Dysgonamonadaceae bacterium]
MNVDNSTNQEQNRTNSQPESSEIDLGEILRKMWMKRKFIATVTGVFILLGLFFAIFSQVKYTARCIVVPQSGKYGSSSNVGSLAAVMGLNMGSTSTSNPTLSPLVYPQIIKSLPFTREIMQTKIVVEKSDGKPISLYDYYTDKQYQPFNLVKAVKKYTFGLPGVIIGAFRKSDSDASSESLSFEADSVGVLTLGPNEDQAYSAIQKSMQLELNQKEGYVELSYVFPEAEAAAQITDQVRKTLEKYVIAFKIAKVEDNLLFVQQSFDIAEKDYLKKQTALAVFQDANQGLISATARTTQARLQTEFNIAYTVYSELAKQLEQAKISVKETKPILTVIDPVVVPTQKSAPRRGIILFGFLFFGFVASTGWIFASPVIKELIGKMKES